MAVTSIWPIKGRVDTVINYARNPEKTREKAVLASMHEIDGVVEYAANEMKTETRAYVSCIGVTSEETAAKDFIATKKQYEKTDGRLCYHGYQSFRAGEVDAATAHKIGVELAMRLWGDRFQVVIATHCNTGHYHNHFVINSVSDRDGFKFYNSHEDYRKMREESDRLCREYGISVVENPQAKGKNYAEWNADQQGKPTWRGIIRGDIDRAIAASTTPRHFLDTLQEMGYELKIQGVKHPALRPPKAKNFFRFYRLGDGYSYEEILERIMENGSRQLPFPEFNTDVRSQYHPEKLPHKKLTGLHALYIRYCFELHILEEHPTSVKRVSSFLREDLIKLDKLDAQTRFLGANKIDTMQQLQSKRAEIQSRIEALVAERSDLRNQLKREKRKEDMEAAARVQARVSEISDELRTLRKEVVLCDAIEERSSQIRENLEQLYAEQESERKEEENHELRRRRSRSGC